MSIMINKDFVVCDMPTNKFVFPTREFKKILTQIKNDKTKS